VSIDARVANSGHGACFWGASGCRFERSVGVRQILRVELKLAPHDRGAFVDGWMLQRLVPRPGARADDLHGMSRLPLFDPSSECCGVSSCRFLEVRVRFEWQRVSINCFDA
jgi:hypothetical protein